MRYAEYHPGVAGEIRVAAAGGSRYLDEVTAICYFAVSGVVPREKHPSSLAGRVLFLFKNLEGERWKKKIMQKR